MTLANSVNQSQLLPLNTAFNRPFFMGVTGLTLTVTSSKACAAFGAIAGAVTELTDGWYKLALALADNDTEGSLAFHSTDGGTNIEDWCDQVAAPVKLGDKVAHGGPIGSSLATLAVESIWATNPNSGAAALNLNAPLGFGLVCDPLVLLNNSTGNPTVSISGPFSGAHQPVILIDATATFAGMNGGPGIEIRAGAEDGLKITGGTGKQDINLAGNNAISGYLKGIVNPIFGGAGVQVGDILGNVQGFVNGVQTGAVNDVSPSSSSFITTFTGYGNQLKGKAIANMGSLYIETSIVQTLDNATGVMTIEPPFSTAPMNGDSLVIFMGANVMGSVQSDIKKVNDIAIQGSGTSIDPWRPI